MSDTINDILANGARQGFMGTELVALIEEVSGETQEEPKNIRELIALDKKLCEYNLRVEAICAKHHQVDNLIKWREALLDFKQQMLDYVEAFCAKYDSVQLKLDFYQRAENLQILRIQRGSASAYLMGNYPVQFIGRYFRLFRGVMPKTYQMFCQEMDRLEERMFLAKLGYTVVANKHGVQNLGVPGIKERIDSTFSTALASRFLEIGDFNRLFLLIASQNDATEINELFDYTTKKFQKLDNNTHYARHWCRVWFLLTERIREIAKKRQNGVVGYTYDEAVLNLPIMKLSERDLYTTISSHYSAFYLEEGKGLGRHSQQPLPRSLDLMLAQCQQYGVASEIRNRQTLCSL